MKHSILCVDDESDNVDALERLFRKKYQVFKATSGDEGLRILSQQQVSLIISDQRMPNMTGVEMLSKSVESHPDAIRILLTGYTDIDSVIDAINSGEVYRYMTKPWDPVDLQNTVDKALEKFDLRLELAEKNQALEQALNELKSLDQAKTQFMYLVNHELKTPLTVLSSFLELLLETKLDGDQKKYLKRISESKDRLNKLIHDVLELVSAESGTMALNPTKISPDNMVNAIVESVSDAAKKKSQTIELDLESLAVNADVEIIGKVLQRILDNAIKFGDEKSKITVAARLNKNGNVEFSITNQGKPLSPEVIEKILKPFALDEDIMNHTQGLGLGLSLCQALLKRHSSQLQMSSQKGTVQVSFELPSATIR